MCNRGFNVVCIYKSFLLLVSALFSRLADLLTDFDTIGTTNAMPRKVTLFPVSSRIHLEAIIAPGTACIGTNPLTGMGRQLHARQ